MEYNCILSPACSHNLIKWQQREVRERIIRKLSLECVALLTRNKFKCAVGNLYSMRIKRFRHRHAAWPVEKWRAIS